MTTAASSNGKTPGFGPGDAGSIPTAAAITRRKWSDAEIEAMRMFYMRAVTSKTMNLAALAQQLGRDKANVARKARSLGLTDQCRPKTGYAKLPLRMFDTAEQRSVASSARAKARIAANGHPRGFKGHTHTEAARAVMAAASKAYASRATPAQVAARVERANMTRVQNPRSPSVFGPNPYSRAKRGKRADLGDVFFRSKWEANYARYLNWLIERGEIARWEFEPDTFVFHGVTRGVLTYTPDFKVFGVDGRHVWHEVKGWMDARSKAKLKRMGKFYPAETVLVIGPAEYRAIAKWSGLISCWE